MRALSWNVYHGRSPNPAGRSLLGDFADALAGWEWDVALLQEVPPSWPAVLGGEVSDHRVVRLTGVAGARAVVGPPADPRDGQPLRPNPRSISIARSPAVPGLGSTPRSIAALYTS